MTTLLETKEREIEGTSYRVTPLGAKAGQKLLHRLFKVLGPTLADLVAEAATNPKTGAPDIGLSNVAAGVKTLASVLSESDFEHVVETMTRSTQVCVDRASDAWRPLASDFEIRFAAKYDQLLRLVAFFLEVNYSGFFDASMLSALPAGLASKAR